MAYPDLTDVDAVRRSTGSSHNDRDEEIAALITSASIEAMSYTGREFLADPDAPAARRFLYQGGGVLPLTPYDLQADQTVAVTLDPEGSSPTTVAAARVRLLPIPSRYGVAHSLQMLDEPGCGRDGRIVEITGTWGFPTVPSDVERAIIDTVNFAISREAMMGGMAEAQPGSRYGAVRFPSSAMFTLGRYRIGKGL